MTAWQADSMGQRDVSITIYTPESAPLPRKLPYITDSTGGKVRYVGAALRTVRGGKKFDVIVCGHLQLLPLALALRAWTRGPLVLLLYGIEAWSPRGAITRLLLRGVSRFVSISRIGPFGRISCRVKASRPE